MKNGLYTLVFFFLLTTITDAQQAWTLQTNPLGAQVSGTPTCGKIQFVSPTEGWITTGNGKLLHTTDGGTAWTVVTPGGSDTVTFFNNPDIGLSFISTTTGWVIGTLVPGHKPHGAVLYKTTNGGTTWSRQLLTPWLYGNAIQFTDANNGWVGVFGGNLSDSSSGSILHTIDGGVNWTAVYTANREFPIFSFIDANNGWALTDSLSNSNLSTGEPIAPYKILHTTDGGSTWNIQLTDNTLGFLEQLQFVDANNGWVVGDSAKIFHTSNGGANWTLITNAGENSSSQNTAVFFLNSNNGWIAHGVHVLHTTNGGATWTSNSTPIQYSIFSISFVDANNGWLSADRGGIAHTTTGGEPPTAIPLSLAAGWNMVSVPLTVNDYLKTSLFPNAISNAFDYSGSYNVKDTLKNGVGYWVMYSADETDSIKGGERTLDTLALTAGWNMIGSISAAVSVGSITTIPPTIITSNFFEYTGSYIVADSIKPGKAYWVYALEPGSLILKK